MVCLEGALKGETLPFALSGDMACEGKAHFEIACMAAAFEGGLGVKDPLIRPCLEQKTARFHPTIILCFDLNFTHGKVSV